MSVPFVIPLNCFGADISSRAYEVRTSSPSDSSILNMRKKHILHHIKKYFFGHIKNKSGVSHPTVKTVGFLAR